MPWPIPEIRNADCHPERKHYARGLCRSCYDKRPERLDKIRTNQTRWRKVHSNRLTNIWRKSYYGIEDGVFEAVLEKQGGRCAICRESFHAPCLDHCHTTKRIRGILCKSCNSGLGFFRDDPALLTAAAGYLTNEQM